MSKPKPTYTTCAKDGGANQSKTTLPPPSDAYRDNFDDIFRKKPTHEKTPQTSADQAGEDRQQLEAL